MPLHVHPMLKCHLDIHQKRHFLTVSRTWIGSDFLEISFLYTSSLYHCRRNHCNKISTSTQ